MRKPLYPKLTPENAKLAAEFYIWLKKEGRPRRPTEYSGNSRTKQYRGLIPVIHRLMDNGIIDGRTVGDAGWIVWLTEWIKT